MPVCQSVSEGLAMRHRRLSLRGRCMCIAVWITSRGVGELPWIARGLEHLRGIDVPQSRDGLDIAMENLKDLCRVLDAAARREPQGKRTE